MTGNEMTMDRRTFAKATGALGALAFAGGAVGSVVGDGVVPAYADEGGAEDTIVWTHCAVNCGGACPLKCHVRDGKLVYVESDTTGSGKFGDVQARACLRGRSIKQWLDSEDRLNYPMRRVAGTKRGDGQYERISWDEALDTIASEIDRVIKQYGNEAIFVQECSGVEQNIMMNNPFFRLLNLKGGELTRYGSYSSASISFGAVPYVYGSSFGSNSFKSLKQDELVVMFGFAPNDMRMAGDGHGYDLMVAHEQKNVRIISIDPRRTETCTNLDAEWIPIVPGTDAALVAGLAHELIKSNLVDIDFLHKYVVGFDEETMPEDARGKHLSYYDYVMGMGYDQVEKTPEWASSITHIPAERIVKLAHEIGEAKPCCICQGLGMQRHANGDNASRSVMALALMVGQAGKPATAAGGTIGNGGIGLGSLPSGKNPVSVKIPQFLWPEAIRDGKKLTAAHDGIMGADSLSTGIKLLINYGNNMMANQNADINKTTEILRDESLCEFILQYDVAWTDSCNWADIVLPDLTPQETYSLTAAGEANDVAGIRFGQPLYEPRYERREIYEVCGELAKRLGVYDEYSNGGMTREDWCRKLYEDLREKVGDKYDMPTYDEGVKMGTFTFAIDPADKTEPFIEDPEAHPLKTKTGKAQIYSPEYAAYAETWTLDPEEKNAITPLPIYVPGPDSAEDLTEEFPLQILDFHPKCTTHSTYAHNPVLNRITPFQAWINPIDAEKYGIGDLDRVRITTAQGSMITQAKVTNRVMPGVIMHPQGAWHKAPAEGDRTDEGGCTNTLTSRHRNPVSKGTGQHSVIGRIEKVEE